MKKTRQNYYLGLDIGTDSIGWAVTDENYRILRFNGKMMWGCRLFDEAQTAQKRRECRSARRRLQRRRWRIELLQELFAEEICKVDPGFFQRLKDSALLAEDKKEYQKNALFCDGKYSDVDFNQEFPTIYHLRKELLLGEEKQDIRLVYLALHHILKHRGHFLFSGSVKKVTSFEGAYVELKHCLQEVFEIELNCSSIDELSGIIKDKRMAKREKAKKVKTLLHCEKENKQLAAIIGLICGSKSPLSEVFEDESLKEIERPKLSFSETSYDDIRPELEEVLQERTGVLDVIKGVYDWGILAEILEGGEYQGESYISIAKVKKYEKHKEDLILLKDLINKYVNQEYGRFFQKVGNENYCAYIGKTLCNGKKKVIKRCSYKDFSNSVKKILNKITNEEVEDDIKRIREELEMETFLPIQVSKDNGVIPYQVHEMELNKILEHAAKQYSFLEEKDERGKSVKDKIVDLFEFRIPYYVGPINTVNAGNSWMVRKEEGKIRPWNFEDKVDTNQSAEKFIRRMTNKCTYLIGKDVLPKNSLIYSEFMVWNELNNLKIKNKPVSVELKNNIFDEVFKRNRRVTGKKIIQYLHNEGIEVESGDLSGFDQNFKSSLGSYLDMKKVFGDKIEEYSTCEMIEDIILWITLYGDEKKMLKQVIRNHYDEHAITAEQLKILCHFKYQGWGRFSKEFLKGIQGLEVETGEVFNIMRALVTTNDNLMQLLSQRYTFIDELEKENKKNMPAITTISYDSLIKDMIVSPAVKRAIWQVVLIAEEIKKIMGKEPNKIFVEVARSSEEKKRVDSRKKQLIALYDKIKEEDRDWKKELENKEESDFRSIKLYLYYTQMGKCMYSGESINLSQLFDATVYDRDHIYPQSKTKDDSLDNLVLVKREINAKKNADVLSDDIQKKMSGFWKSLKEKGLISEEKYRRLMRKEALTEEELAGFISRQLVETRQSTKAVASLLEQLYQHSKVVYVKAKAVSDFRNETLEMVKVRSMNDYHHAKDSYLNIVVGNVYHEKFTNNPLKWLKTSQERNYSLNRMFDNNLIVKNRTIWERGKEGSIKTIRSYMRKKDIQYTRYAVENKAGQNGGFFDTQMVRKGKATIPRKKGMDVKKYGGYLGITTAYFALVESRDQKGERQKSIEAIPLYLKNEIEQKPEKFLQYCEEIYQLREPKVLIKKIKKDSHFVINGFPMHLRGKTGKQLIFQVAVQLILDDEYEIYLKKIEKYIARKQKQNMLEISEKEGITIEKNIELYDELLKKQEKTIYCYRPASQCRILREGREKFKELSCEEQCDSINEILHLLQCKPLKANLVTIGGSKFAGGINIRKVIDKFEEFKLIHQSTTGLFEQEIDLLSL